MGAPGAGESILMHHLQELGGGRLVSASPLPAPAERVWAAAAPSWQLPGLKDAEDSNYSLLWVPTPPPTPQEGLSWFESITFERLPLGESSGASASILGAGWGRAGAQNQPVQPLGLPGWGWTRAEVRVRLRSAPGTLPVYVGI